MLYKATSYVVNDEPCYFLEEANLISPVDHQWHRFEILIVVRDDELAEFRNDMGLQEKFTEDPIRIMGGVKDSGKIYIEETVGSLRQIAEQLKLKPAFDKKELPALSAWQDTRRKRKLIFS